MEQVWAEIGQYKLELGIALAMVLGCLAVLLGVWIGKRGRTLPVLYREEGAAGSAPVPPVELRHFELLCEVDGEFVSTGEVLNETETSAHEIVLARQAITGKAYAARIVR